MLLFPTPYIFSLLFNYSCPHFLPPLLSPALPTPTSYIPSSLTLLSLSVGPLYMFLDDLSPSFPQYPPTPCLLSFCSLFPCLWFYFAHLFVLLIRFHLQVRSYGIFLSPPGLFQLVQCSPVPSMML